MKRSALIVLAFIAACGTSGRVPPVSPSGEAAPLPSPGGGSETPQRPAWRLLVPSSLHLVEGRPLRLCRSGLVDVTDPTRIAISIAPLDSTAAPLPLDTSVCVGVDSSRVTGDSRIVATAGPGETVQGSVTIATAPRTRTASPTLLVIGDSLTYQGTISALSARLVSAGVTPSFIGTYLEADGLWTEARPSWRFTTFTHKEPAVHDDGRGATIPIVGSVSDYLATDPGPADYSARWSHNPFLRPATPADDTAHVFAGYTFDLRFYLERFRFPDPDIVIIALGANDTAHHDQATATANSAEGLSLLVSRTREALPRSTIAIVVNGFGWPDLWQKHLPFVRHVLDTYGGREAEGLFVLPGYMVVDPTMILPDSVHPGAAGRDQWAELVFAFVMNRL